ncbi:Uncharacterized protein Rs2_47189 [Raphanus sativus]|nr:Uncharacterized protein Rs2_47189 [Raphanus sativus]
MYLQQQQLVEIVEILEKLKEDINKFQQDLNKINKKLEQDFCKALNKFDEALKKREVARAQDVQLDDDENEESFIKEDICVVDSVYKDEVCAKLGRDEICVKFKLQTDPCKIRAKYAIEDSRKSFSWKTFWIRRLRSRFEDESSPTRRE